MDQYENQQERKHGVFSISRTTTLRNGRRYKSSKFVFCNAVIRPSLKTIRSLVYEYGRWCSRSKKWLIGILITMDALDSMLSFATHYLLDPQGTNYSCQPRRGNG